MLILKLVSYVISSSYGKRCEVLVFFQKFNFTFGMQSPGLPGLLQLNAGFTVFALPCPRAAG